MNSMVLHGYTSHSRIAPVRHTFRYPIYIFIFDVDELPKLDQDLRWFGYNRSSLYSLFDKDYLTGDPSKSLRQRVLWQLREKDYAGEVARIECVTTPRFISPTFNPATFYFCYDASNRERAIILEVNNTFGERHTYVFDVDGDENATHSTEKAFYVSPFNDVSGSYKLLTKRSNGRLHISLDIERDGERFFHSNVYGEILPLNRQTLLRTAIKYPFVSLLTLPRITWEAAKLYYGKHMNVQVKPLPTHANTTEYERPSFLARLGRTFFERFLSEMKDGALMVQFPDGSQRRFGDSTSSSVPVLFIHSNEFFSRLVLRGDIAFGESYTDDLIDSSNLTEVLSYFSRNVELVNSKRAPLSAFATKLIERQHRARINSKKGSKRNIQEHYDLSNELFTRMLDNETMMYSCAYFEHEEQSLADAQRAKLTKIIERARLGENDHVLEVGTGWGGFAIEAVKQSGCRVTSVTLSEEQLEYAREWIAREGLSDKIDVQLCDYRDIEGQFDKIISIEMLEAVGHEYYETYFNKCASLLKPGGLMVLQTITIPDERYENAKGGYDWIQQYIFPGSTIPSIERLEKAVKDTGSLSIADFEEIGPHYAPTLAAWRKSFNETFGEIKRFGFDERFRRMWNYYLCYCEAGFKTKAIGNVHLELHKTP